MIRTVRAEWIKLRTVTMNWVLASITVALPLLVTLLTAAFNSDKPGKYSTSTLLEGLAGASIFTGLVHGVIATTGITGEFGFGTIRPTLAATPSRLRVVAAKAAVAVASGAGITTAVLLVGYVGSSLIADGNGVQVDLGEVADGPAPLVGAVVFAALMSLVGLGVGLLTRSTPGSVTILLAWPLIVEGLVGGLVGMITGNERVTEWFPFQCGVRLMTVSGEFSSLGEPGRLASGLVFGAFAAVVLALGTWSLQRRDA